MMRNGSHQDQGDGKMEAGIWKDCYGKTLKAGDTGMAAWRGYIWAVTIKALNPDGTIMIRANGWPKDREIPSDHFHLRPFDN
jgi:hypothetical protein